MRKIYIVKNSLFLGVLGLLVTVPFISQGDVSQGDVSQGDVSQGDVAQGDEALFFVPELSGAAISERSEKRIVLTTSQSHAEVMSFYKGYVQDLPNIKIIDRKDYVQIVDHGNLPWHSINVDKEPHQGQLAVEIVRDSWSWILGTLVLRFIGVFVVLAVLFLGMAISGKILPLFAKSVEDHKEDFSDSLDVVTDNDQELVAVAIAAATHYKNRQQGAM